MIYGTPHFVGRFYLPLAQQTKLMGLFSFFKKKEQPQDNTPETGITSIQDKNVYLLFALQNKLIALGYKVEKNPKYLGLIVDSELEIATVIIDNPNNHPNIIHLMVLTIHPVYFPDGIEENLVGIGSNIEEKTESVLNNYLNTTFNPIMQAFTDSHNADLDFSTTETGREILWHPKPGNISLQGKWTTEPEEDIFLELLKERIKPKLADQKFNWLKVYISKQDNREPIGECLFNNEPWQEGYEIILKYAETWKNEGAFHGLKQFIMFRRCDAFEK